MAFPTSVRFPDDVRQVLVERALAERRTVSNLVVLLVADGLRAGAGESVTRRVERDPEEELIRELDEGFAAARVEGT